MEEESISLPRQWAEFPLAEPLVLEHPNAGPVPFYGAKLADVEPGVWMWDDGNRMHYSDREPEPAGETRWTWVDSGRRFTVRAATESDYANRVLLKPGQ